MCSLGRPRPQYGYPSLNRPQRSYWSFEHLFEPNSNILGYFFIYYDCVDSRVFFNRSGGTCTALFYTSSIYRSFGRNCVLTSNVKSLKPKNRTTYSSSLKSTVQVSRTIDPREGFSCTLLFYSTGILTSQPAPFSLSSIYSTATIPSSTTLLLAPR